MALAKADLRFKIKDFRIIGIDQDHAALKLAADNLKSCSDKITLVHGNFRDTKAILKELKIEKVAGILADLGLSSMQLSDPERGFSFRHDAPLDMRMNMGHRLLVLGGSQILRANTQDQLPELTAWQIIHAWNESKIADILWRYGEERFARKIAKAIAQNRKNINSTKDLSELCEKCVPPRFRKHKIHPATKTFQALRIVVNDEIEALNDFLRDAPELLAPGGRLVIISFHSLEDRLVKQKFNELASGGDFEKITKQVVTASDNEVISNPRARSAKLRVIEKSIDR